MSDALGFLQGVTKGSGITYNEENITHTIRFETDDMEICKPKPFRKGYQLFRKKIVIVHWKGNDEYVILEIK